jgi:hypothetical protein
VREHTLGRHIDGLQHDAQLSGLAHRMDRVRAQVHHDLMQLLGSPARGAQGAELSEHLPSE